MNVHLKSNFLFLLCFKIAIIKSIPMRQQSRQRNSFFSSRFTSNLMLQVCLGMILVVNAVCNSKIARNFSTLTDLKKSDKDECLRGALAA